MAVGERLQNFESGTAGAASTSNPPTSNGQTAFGAIGVTGTGAVNVVAAAGMSGSQYLECTQTTTTGSDAYARWLGYTTVVGSFAFSWQTDSLPSSGTQIFTRSFSGGNSARWLNLTINSANHMVISVYNGTTDVIVWTSVQTISAATNYQIAAGFSAFATSSTVTLAVNVYTDDFNTLWETGYSGTPTIAGTATNVVDFRFGRNSVTLTGPKFRYDNIRLTDATSALYGPVNALTATLASTATITAAGAKGFTGAATAATTAALTSAGTVGAAGQAAIATTATITAAGVVGKTQTATLTATATITTTATITATTGATLATTATITAAGLVGRGTDAAVPTTVTITTAGSVAETAAASVVTTVTITAAGVVTARAPEAIAGHATLTTQPAVTTVIDPPRITASLEAQP